jgi:hypothetical protein
MSPLSARFRSCAAAAAPAALLVACGTLAACSDDDRRFGPIAPGAAPLVSATVSPAAVRGLAVVFLPPLQPARKAPFIGTFDASRSPTVEVCRWTGTQCDGAPIARFTRAEGTGGTLLTVDAAQQLYQADWKAEGLTAGARYRIRVLLGGMELGHADAQVPGGGTSAGVILDAGLVPLGANRSLPIRFRLETSTSYLPGDPGAPASASIPRQDFVPRAADYSTGHPTLPGAVLSHNTIVLAPGSDATVGQINALLADLGAERVGGIPGAPGAAAGLLALRLPTATHTDLQAVLTRLRTDTRVATVVQDARVSGDVLPAPGTGLAADQHWTWDLGANDGNWGHELVRVPQLWNLNAGLKRVLEAGQVLGPSVGVLDGGFVQGHPDLVFAANLDPERSSRHGSLVAGIVGATYGNGVGVDGVNPFARLVVGGVPMDSVNPTQTLQRSSSSMGLLWELYALVRSRPGIRVVNVSQGYNWYMMTPRISTSDTTVQRIATAQGAAAVEMLRSLQSANGQLPVIAASAGNGSAVGLGLQTARYSSPLANAAIVHGAAPVIVVEASTGTAAGALARAPFSNIGGHVSAPGTDILSTDSIPGKYAPCDGTSCAAPYVAGVASYLYALHPTLVVTLTSNPIRKLLVETGSPASGLPPHLDAFAAAMALDSEMGGSAVLRTLVDVDDGTLDGNTRTNADGSDYTADAHGDGRVDMRDFRRWRDWYLAAQKKPGVQLDGSPRHPKKDVNGNLRWDVDGDHENVFPARRLQRQRYARPHGHLQGARRDAQRRGHRPGRAAGAVRRRERRLQEGGAARPHRVRRRDGGRVILPGERGCGERAGARLPIGRRGAARRPHARRGNADARLHGEGGGRRAYPARRGAGRRRAGDRQRHEGDRPAADRRRRAVGRTVPGRDAGVRPRSGGRYAAVLGHGAGAAHAGRHVARGARRDHGRGTLHRSRERRVGGHGDGGERLGARHRGERRGDGDPGDQRERRPAATGHHARDGGRVRRELVPVARPAPRAREHLAGRRHAERAHQGPRPLVDGPDLAERRFRRAARQRVAAVVGSVGRLREPGPLVHAHPRGHADGILRARQRHRHRDGEHQRVADHRRAGTRVRESQPQRVLPGGRRAGEVRGDVHL